MPAAGTEHAVVHQLLEIVMRWIVADSPVNHSDVDFSQDVGNFARISFGAPPSSHTTLGVGFHILSSFGEAKDSHSFGYSCFTIQLKTQSCLWPHAHGRAEEEMQPEV